MEKKVFKLQSKLESFRKNNIVDPIDQAKTREKIENKIELEINQLESNMSRLNLIKNDISSNMLLTNGFFEQLQPDLGLTFSGSDQQLFENYNNLQMEFADAQTKYKNNSTVLKNLQQRLDILFPELKEKQLSTIEIALLLIKEKFKLQKIN